MFLVHVRLRPHTPDAMANDHLAAVTAPRLRDAPSIEHFMMHPGDDGALTIGLYIPAQFLEQAETRAEIAVRSALHSDPPVPHWDIVHCAVPLIACLHSWTSSHPGQE